VPRTAAHYESFFLKACHPDGGLAVWIRYTVHQRPNAAAKGFLWFTLFDATAGVAASKIEHPNPTALADTYVRIGDSSFGPGHVSGVAASPQLEASWDLRFEGDESPLWHLPRWAYKARLPKTKLLSPHPHVVFTGQIRAGGRSIEIEKWPGTVGHNWGSEHARRAIWIHGSNFKDHEDAWLDLALGRVRLGAMTTPWIANGELSLDGQRHRLGGIGRVRGTKVDEAVEECRFVLPGDDVRLTGSVEAPRRNFVAWIYAQPKWGERQTINCSIADLRLEVTRPQRAPLNLELSRGAAYELQMEERHPEIPVQPFPDG
jgi:hypothetical protein